MRSALLAVYLVVAAGALALRIEGAHAEGSVIGVYTSGEVLTKDCRAFLRWRADVKPLLSCNLDGDLQFYRVDRKVNASSRTDKLNDDASMIEPITPL